MTILQEGKKVVIDVVFAREFTNNTTMKLDYAYFQTQCTFAIWNEEEFSDHTLRLISGHTGQFVEVEKGKRKVPERIIKVFLVTSGGCSELEFHDEQPLGVRFKRSKEEKKLTREEASELIRSGKVRFFDNDKLELSKVYTIE
jgi:hypothetical protein